MYSITKSNGMAIRDASVWQNEEKERISSDGQCTFSPFHRFHSNSLISCFADSLLSLRPSSICPTHPLPATGFNGRTYYSKSRPVFSLVTQLQLIMDHANRRARVRESKSAFSSDTINTMIRSACNVMSVRSSPCLAVCVRVCEEECEAEDTRDTEPGNRLNFTLNTICILFLSLTRSHFHSNGK